MAVQAGASQLRVAVVDSPGEGPLSSGLADFIEIALQKNGVETYDRRHLRVLLAERGLAKTEVLDADSLRRMPLPAMKVFVRGTAEPTSTNHFALTVGAFWSSDGTLLAKAAGEGEYPRDWLGTVERVVGVVARHVLETQTNSPQEARPRTVMWMPEASSWFFRGMECYGAQDYAQAAVCFWKAQRWDGGFSLARLWEVKSYRQAGFPELANALLDAGRVAGLPAVGRADQRIAVVEAGEGITREQRTAFEQGLAASKDVSLLEPGWLGATAEEADLQLTGEMVPRSENRNVWLAVDDVVMLEKVGQRIRARRLDVVRATETDRADTEELSSEGLQHLAGRLLRGGVGGTAEEHPPAPAKLPPAYFPEGSMEAMRVQALRAAQAHPKDVASLIAAADSYREAALGMEPTVLAGVDYPSDWRMQRALLDRAIGEIQARPDQPEASFWLTCALWRKRISRENHMVTWNKGSRLTPLKDDFKQLFEMYPASTEATNLAEVLSDHFYARTMPKDERFTQAVSTLNQISPTNALALAAEEQKRTLVEEFKRSFAEKNYCRAWLAQRALRDKGGSIKVEAPEEAWRFLVACRNANYKIDNQPIIDQFGQGNLPASASQLLESYTPVIDGDRRAGEITAICQPFIKQARTPKAIMLFLAEQSGRWAADYGAHAITPMSNLGDGTRDPVSLFFLRAQMDASTSRCADAAIAFEAIQKLPNISPRVLLSARYGEGIARYTMGDYYAATELLRGVLAELEAVSNTNLDVPAAFSEKVLSALRTVRLFGDPTVDFRLCCGPPAILPFPPGAKTNELEVLFAKFKAQLAGQRDTNTPPVKIADMGLASVLALVSREVAAEGVPQDTYKCIKALGQSAAPLAPQLISLVLINNDNNAMAALSYLGRRGAGAAPVVLLCLANAQDDRAFLQNARMSLQRLGAPPRRSMPYLARLLYHPNQFVAFNTAKVIKDARLLPPEVQERLTDDDLVSQIQGWWERTGSFQSWKDPKGESAR